VCHSPTATTCAPVYPYTTLFRSRRQRTAALGAGALRAPAPGRRGRAAVHRPGLGVRRDPAPGVARLLRRRGARRHRALDAALPRSEEHTSELQLRENLVCRLLLE